MRTAKLVLLMLLAAPLLTTLPACETTGLFEGNPENAMPESADWQTSEPIVGAVFEDLWERTQATLDRMGYNTDTALTEYDQRTIVTHWVAVMAPTRFEGFRRRAHVKFEKVGEDWVVRVAVLRQRNADIDDPSNPAQANWERAGTDITRGALLIFRIRSAFESDRAGTPDTPATAPGAAPAKSK